MKTALTALISAALFMTPGARAEALPEINLNDLTYAIAAIDTQGLEDWKVGDTMTHSVSLMGMNMGTSVKTMSKDEGTALWLHQEIKAMSQNQTVDALINKADGKVLKMIQNGKEIEVPNEKIEIISQDAETITVKAGTFKCIHIVAKSEKVSKIELWANPRDTALDGAVKQKMATQFGEMTLELQSFVRK